MKPLHFEYTPPRISSTPILNVSACVYCQEYEDTPEGPMSFRIIHYMRDADWILDHRWVDTDWVVGYEYLPANWYFMSQA